MKPQDPPKKSNLLALYNSGIESSKLLKAIKKQLGDVEKCIEEDSIKRSERKWWNFSNRTTTLELEAIDLHHDPIGPEQYIQFRMMPAIAFYQSRLKRYYFAQTAFQLFMILSAAACAFMAFLELDYYVTLITVISASVTAYSEFYGASVKLDRYSRNIKALNKLILRWRSLTSVEQAGAGNINDMVNKTELLLQNELQAWLASSREFAEDDNKYAVDVGDDVNDML